MAFGLLKRFVGDSNERALKALQPVVDEVAAIEPELERWYPVWGVPV